MRTFLVETPTGDILVEASYESIHDYLNQNNLTDSAVYPMLMVVYDPIDGVTVPDGKVASYVEDMLTTFRAGFGNFCVGSEMIIDQLRLAILERKVDPRFIRITSAGEFSLELNEFGNPANGWPHHFFPEPLCSKILQAAVKLRQAKKDRQQ